MTYLECLPHTFLAADPILQQSAVYDKGVAPTPVIFKVSSPKRYVVVTVSLYTAPTS